MARNRTIPSEFWTCEAVIDCKPMTRLLFIGLWNFADDHGVQPLRPRTIRLQVFPGDPVGNDDVRAMIDELARHKLVRIYEVDGAEYLEIIDWDQFQRVGKNARRRYPAFHSAGESQGPQSSRSETVPGVGEAVEEIRASTSTAADDDPPQIATSDCRPPSPPGGEKEQQFTDPAPLSQAA